MCAWLLRGADHGHDHGHGHGDHGHHEDLNLRSAYVHVLADAATSVLAIVALFGGKLWGASWLDTVMGLVGAVLVTAWAFSLMRDSGKVLLDAEMDAPVVEEVREVIARAQSLPPSATSMSGGLVRESTPASWRSLHPKTCLLTTSRINSQATRSWFTSQLK